MDANELRLLDKYAAQDEELKSLWDEHKLFENQLEKLSIEHSMAKCTTLYESSLRKLRTD